MDVRLSPEQRALRDSAVQLVEKLRPRTIRDLDDTERVAKLDAAVDASGWRGLRSADDDGAPWASAVEVSLVAEELARGLADTAFIGPVLAADLRRLGGSPPASSRETVAFRSDLSGPAHAEEGVLAGPVVAFDAAGADTALVLDGERDGYGLFSVSLTRPGHVVDLTRLTVALPGSDNIPPVAAQHHAITDADLLAWTALGLAVTSADLVGAMRGALDLARDYASVRTQFGTTIGSFQAVQHLLADALVATEGSRSIALHAAWAVDALAPADALAAAAAAKAYCARAARSVCETTIQVHGGIGNTWDCLAHVYLRRALASGDLLGGIGPNLVRVLEHRGIGGAHGLR